LLVHPTPRARRIRQANHHRAITFSSLALLRAHEDAARPSDERSSAGRRLTPWRCLWGTASAWRATSACSAYHGRRTSKQRRHPGRHDHVGRGGRDVAPPTWPSCPGLRAGDRSEGQTPASAYIRRSVRRRLMMLNWCRRACFPRLKHLDEAWPTQLCASGRACPDPPGPRTGNRIGNLPEVRAARAAGCSP
jgi:hypothetical protein